MSSIQESNLVSILSTEHGRLRREQRDISKRDLQKALAHAVPERAWGRRWKLEFDDTIFIVDNAMSREVTAYPSPLKTAPVDLQVQQDHEKAKTILQQKPERCKSHTVLVVDNSGSMQAHDIPLHRDRQVAAYATLALEFIAEQLFKYTANNSDVVSLVEFSETARVIFTREPCTWVLYNKLLSRRESRDFKSRQDMKLQEVYRADSNYLPALTLASKLLDIGRHDACALALLFLSDGEPSDARQHNWTSLRAKTTICEVAAKLATTYNECLKTISFVGFGNASGDFSTLEAMADACNRATGSTRAEFTYSGKLANRIGTAVTSLTSSLTQTRTSLMGGGSMHGPRRVVASETDAGAREAWRFFKILDHWVYSPRSERLVRLPMIPPGAQREEDSVRRHIPMYLAMNSHHCGNGAERIAFRCSLADRTSKRSFALGPMVAKETNLVDLMEDNMAFHVIFCETQSLASFLADEFNMRVRAMPTYNAFLTPIISFLPCSVLELEDHTVSNGIKDVLVEKMLDTSRFRWRKWNDNGGGVDEQACHSSLDLEYEFKSLALATEPAVIEEGSEEESEDDESDEDPKEVGPEEGDSRVDNTAHSAYLQAFSHFSYVFTNKKILVCDLQGVYNTDTVPPSFELTDPAIHYYSKKGRRMVYGRTDKGKRGMDRFMKTHKCSELCQFVNLSKSNLKWRKAWQEHHHRKYLKFENPLGSNQKLGIWR
jgi:Alpha-kinase family/von Willebrand factor type A domain